MRGEVLDDAICDISDDVYCWRTELKVERVLRPCRPQTQRIDDIIVKSGNRVVIRHRQHNLRPTQSRTEIITLGLSQSLITTQRISDYSGWIFLRLMLWNFQWNFTLKFRCPKRHEILCAAGLP